MVLGYINEIQRQFIEKYGFKENPEKPGVPLCVPDGEYPMVIEGRLDNVEIVKGMIHCCNFEESNQFKDLSKVKDLAQRLSRFLKNPEPGLSTWHTAVGNLMKELRDELNKVLTALGIDSFKNKKRKGGI